MLATTQPKVDMTVGSSWPSDHAQRSPSVSQSPFSAAGTPDLVPCRSQQIPAMQLRSSSPPTTRMVYFTTTRRT
ncbi:hypothetical protein ElyMa_003812300 [Elysia marginata]|uniref:Uncharacterized protein n=1 Tax=Elysia marginata TaxID=1093978 RepID=A0AAV4FDA8_9GAST|nr:hypothetical protein ElyMa_003812300 [Elysia marginata]